MRYIGISGVVYGEEMLALREIAKQHETTLAIGVLMSQKAMETGVGNARTPAFADLPALLEHGREIEIYVHYFTKNSDTLISQLDCLMSSASACAGIQLNVPWPDPIALELFRDRHPTKRVILQISRASMAACLNDEREALRRLGRLAGLATDVLIDMSAGTGEDIPLAHAERMIDGIQSLPGEPFGIGIAGGLRSNHSLTRIRDLLRRRGPISVDAETNLRDAHDVLDMGRVGEYVRAAETAMGVKNWHAERGP